MTPEEYLSELASQQNLTDNERDTISSKHLSLREKLRELLPVEGDFLTGSYPRYTMIRPNEEEKFDVDFFLAFSNEVFGEYELPELLEMVKDALEEIKDEEEDVVDIIEQNRSIAVDYKGNFQIDVVPAIEIERDELYKIFDKRTQTPIKSNPKLHSKNLSEANEESAFGSVKRLVPIIKLLKFWKREKCDYVKSFHIELLAVEILQGEAIATFSSGLKRFFSRAPEYLDEASLADPANEENLVDTYLDEEGTRNEILTLIEQEKENAELAHQYEEDGEDDKAIEEWKRLFESGGSESKGGRRRKSDGPRVVTRFPKQHCDV